MQSLKELYKIGNGPSSSHTVGPVRAVKYYLDKYPNTENVVVTLYGSLAATGKGHGTDSAITLTFMTYAKNKVNVEFIWFPNKELPRHPNALTIQGTNTDSSKNEIMEIYSIGGGTIHIENEPNITLKSIYKQTCMNDITLWCKENNKEIWELTEEVEGKEIWQFLSEVWQEMQKSIQNGLNAPSTKLTKTLDYVRKANSLNKWSNDNTKDTTLMARDSKLRAYAYAVSEENAAGNIVVTAPTCGACGVLPATLKYVQEIEGFSDDKILKALVVAGLIGNVIKKNASISGAEVGCQGEVGSACAMTAGAVAYLYGLNVDQIDYAAEVGLEHHLGLTCDPVGGFVIYPCIERNVVAASRALDAARVAQNYDTDKAISFDTIVITMYQTGIDMKSKYRETAKGGIAKFFKRKISNTLHPKRARLSKQFKNNVDKC